MMEADPDERSTYLIGLAKNAQQLLRYSLCGHAINDVCEKVLTPRDIHPSHDVKLQPALTGEHARKSFMDM